MQYKLCRMFVLFLLTVLKLMIIIIRCQGGLLAICIEYFRDKYGDQYN